MSGDELWGRRFLIPRSDKTLEECQDKAEWDRYTSRFAVADGVSEALFSGSWADALVKEFVGGPEFPLASQDDTAFAGFLTSCRQAWKGGYFDGRMRKWAAEPGGVPWNIAEKVEALGTSATFVGMRVLPPGPDGSSASLCAVAVGDSCLLVVRNGRLSSSFPLTANEPFTLLPPQINGFERFKSAPPLWLPRQDVLGGDILILATDGVAPALMAGDEARGGKTLGDTVLGWWKGGGEAYEASVLAWRAQRLVSDDDAAALVVRVPESWPATTA